MSLSFTETDEVLQIGMHKVLEYIKNHGDAWPFMDPVEEDIAPRYYSIIRRFVEINLTILRIKILNFSVCFSFFFFKANGFVENGRKVG